MLNDHMRITRLAAARAATNPQRQQLRNDILISALVELAADKASMTTADATDLLNQLWRTRVLSGPVVEQALEVAEKIGLFTRTDGASGTAWGATREARRRAERDRAWIERRWSRLVEAVRIRLEETCDVPVRPERIESLTTHLFEALAEGAEGVMRVTGDFSSFEDLRPVVYEVDRIRDYLRREIEPRPVMRAMLDLAMAAINPLDDFADDIVDLIITGAILHSVVTRKDVPHHALAGSRAVLDTGVLLDLLCPDEPDSLLKKVLEESRAAGIEMIVPEHVLEEWERLWMDADAEIAGLSADERESLRSGGYRLATNAIVKEFFRADPEISWTRFQLGKRDPRRTLIAERVTIREHGNQSDKDREVVEGIYKTLLQLAEDPRTAAVRRPKSARVDAESAAMIARWRRESPETFPTAWFISADRLTSQAYEKLPIDDPYPLTMSPERWVLFLSATRAEPPDIGSLARALAHALRRNSVLAIATTFPASEAARIARDLAKGRAVDDLADLNQEVFNDFLRVYAPGRGKRHIDDLARLVAKERARRDEHEAAREEELSRAATPSTRSAERSVDGPVVEDAPEPATHEDELVELRSVKKELQAQVHHERQRMEKMRRLAIAAPIVSTVALATFFLVVFGQISGPSSAVAGIMTAVTAVLAARYWQDPDASGWTIVSIFLVDALLVAAEVLLGEGVL